MKNFRGAALAAGVGTPESVPHESEQDSFDFKHRNSRTVLAAIRAFLWREDNVSTLTSSSRTVLVAFRSSACREDIVSTSTSSSLRVYSEVVYYQSFGISSCSFGTISRYYPSVSD